MGTGTSPEHGPFFVGFIMDEKIKTSEVIYREDLYPRSVSSPELVQTYAENLDVLPPIEVNQNNILIDGWHRWTAHKKNGILEIVVIITETASESELKLLAAERNTKHGWQMTRQDKQDFARSTYHATPEKERAAVKERLQGVLSVSKRTMQTWLSRIDKDTKQQQKKKVFDLWMQCRTQDEIAAEVGLSQPSVKEILSKNAKLPKSIKFQFQDESFTPPIYNVWKLQKKSNKVSHFGNSEQQWLENLLYLYTEPFDIVVDPFAGGGSTIDVCKKRGRRYYVSDRKPIVEREHEIRLHDLTEGLPSVPRWKDVKLVFLDPPYWKQAEGRYSDDDKDLANMPLNDFHAQLHGIITEFSRKLKGYESSKYIALILQPTQWKAPNRTFTDHIVEMLKTVNLPVNMRYSVPYESQQCTAQMVEWAKQNKQTLVLTREIIVWEVN